MTTRPKSPRPPQALALYVDFECTSNCSFIEAHRYKKFAACLNGYSNVTNPTPVAAIPCSSRQQAWKLAKWANLPRELKVEAIAREMQSSALDGGIWDECHDLRKTRYRERATAILNLIEGAP